MLTKRNISVERIIVRIERDFDYAKPILNKKIEDTKKNTC